MTENIEHSKYWYEYDRNDLSRPNPFIKNSKPNLKLVPELRYIVTYKDGTVIKDLGYDESYKLFLDAFPNDNNCVITRDVTESQKNSSN